MSKTKIGRMFIVIVNYLDVSVEIASPEEYMSRFCSNLNLNLNRKLQNTATCIAMKVIEMDLLPGRSPITVASTAIYMAARNTVYMKTPTEIRLATGTSENTTRIYTR